MRYVMLAIALLGACDEKEAETEAITATKAQCTELFKHIVSVSPRGRGQDAEKIVAALPYEDMDGCVASEPEIRSCMLAATDVDGVKKCIPDDDKLGCMTKAAKAKAAAEEHNKKVDGPKIETKPFDDIRAKCWAGDTTAAKDLQVD